MPRRMAKDSKKLSEATAMMGKIGGPRGGRERAARLSAERRKEIAQKAAQARWNRAKAEKQKPSGGR
jgi:hypothetical protein